MGNKTGESVGLQLSSADATTAAAVGVFNANGGVRALGANERLLVDTLSGTASGSNVTKLDLFADADAGGSVGAGERVTVFGFAGGANYFDGGAEGYSLPVGIGLKAKANAAGQVDVTGSGRIVSGTGGTARPAWKAAEHP